MSQKLNSYILCFNFTMVMAISYVMPWFNYYSLYKTSGFDYTLNCMDDSSNNSPIFIILMFIPVTTLFMFSIFFKEIDSKKRKWLFSLPMISMVLFTAFFLLKITSPDSYNDQLSYRYSNIFEAFLNITEKGYWISLVMSVGLFTQRNVSVKSD